jgi:hypothetical protein
MNTEFDLTFFAAVIPLVALNLSLVIWAVIDWNKRKNFKIMDKKIWILIILFVQFLGPAFYLLAGRGDGNN